MELPEIIKIPSITSLKIAYSTPILCYIISRALFILICLADFMQRKHTSHLLIFLCVPSKLPKDRHFNIKIWWKGDDDFLPQEKWQLVGVWCVMSIMKMVHTKNRK